ALEILKGLKDKYESFHEVTYTDEAINACVDLSSRYIQDRFLPDKAIDLMDEAGSKLNLMINEPSKEEAQRRYAEVEKEKQAALAKEDYETAAKLRDEEAELEKILNEGSAGPRMVVDVKHIQDIIAVKTGIPVGKLESDEQ